MISHHILYPGRPVPELEVETVDNGRWRLADRNPQHFTLLVFYRGLHCPICARYLPDLANRLDAFDERGTEVIAVSTDGRDRAERTAEEWKIDGVPLGYGLDIGAARAWGLFISSGRGPSSTGVEEPELFSEPGLFLVRPDRTLYFSSIQTVPFARPSFAEVLAGLDFVLEHDYPPRGEVRDEELARAEPSLREETG